MEIKQEVKVLVVNYECDECKQGVMRPLGGMLLTSPPKYPHACATCGFNQTFDCLYPRTVYEPVSSNKQ